MNDHFSVVCFFNFTTEFIQPSSGNFTQFTYNFPGYISTFTSKQLLGPKKTHSILQMKWNIVYVCIFYSTRNASVQFVIGKLRDIF